MNNNKISFSAPTRSTVRSVSTSSAKKQNTTTVTGAKNTPQLPPIKRIENNVIHYREKELIGHGKVRLYTLETLHSPVNPAVRFENGDYIWYLHGKIHREHGPAYVRNGTVSYYKHGVLHREEGPAVTYPDGTQRWFIDGVEQTQKE